LFTLRHLRTNRAQGQSRRDTGNTFVSVGSMLAVFSVVQASAFFAGVDSTRGRECAAMRQALEATMR